MVLLWPAERPIRVLGQGMAGADFVEIVLDQKPLRDAMLEFSRNILILSLVISGITASLVYFALQFFIVRPVRRLTGAIAAFGDEPEDASRILAPSRRTDEIGVAERSLAQMETALADVLRQKSHLAELGLAVSKINHELRNMLTTAQLLTDRLEGIADPAVQRVAPRLVATLGRAIEFCQATLAYGRAAERLPERRRVLLAPIVTELRDLTALVASAGISLQSEVAPDLEVDADPDQLSRVLVNLVRNSVQALSQAGTRDGPPRIAITARREGGDGDDPRRRQWTRHPGAGARPPLLGLPQLGPRRAAPASGSRSQPSSCACMAARCRSSRRRPAPASASCSRTGRRDQAARWQAVSRSTPRPSASRRTRGCKASAEALSQPSDRRLS